MTPTVSVIIPVYRVQDFLSRCVDSVLAQSLSDIEAILVDDGSPDACPALCDAYAAREERVSVVHKANGGLGSARNAGMDAARGKYVFFVDSDDWIDEDTLASLVDVAERSGADFVRYRPMFAGWPGREDGSLCDFGTERGLREGLYDRAGIERDLLPRLIATPQLTLGVIVAAWRSLYRRDFLEAHHLRFYDEIRYSEDTIFSARVVMAARSFYYLDGARFYHYFYNPASITKSFRADRWSSCKALIARFEQDFAHHPTFDFTNQLWLQKIYCVLTALSQSSFLREGRERVAYIRTICEDEVTVRAMRHLDLVDVGPKQKLYLRLVKWKATHLLAAL